MNTPICITDSFGIIRYATDDELHRIDGPAVLYPSGAQAWYQHGEKHRTDGPARIWADGEEEFWLDGQKVDIMVHFLQRL